MIEELKAAFGTQFLTQRVECMIEHGQRPLAIKGGAGAEVIRVSHFARCVVIKVRLLDITTTLQTIGSHPLVRQEVIHRTEEVRAKPSTLLIRCVNRAPLEHLRKEGMAHLASRICIAQGAAEKGNDRLVVGIAKLSQRAPTILGVCLG